jgi:hypothetical protein
MDRNEAIAVLKEIFDRCSYLDASAITLMASKVTERSGCSDYSIHMSTTLDSDSRAIVQGIVKAHGLTYRENEGRLTIFRSKI